MPCPRKQKIASDISYLQYPKFISCSNNKIGWDVDGIELKVWAEKTFRGQQEKNGIIARISSFWRQSQHEQSWGFAVTSWSLFLLLLKDSEVKFNQWAGKYLLPAQEHTALLWALKTTSMSFLLRQQLEKEDFLAKVAVSAKIYRTATALQIFTASKYSLIGSFSLLTCMVARLLQLIICGAQLGFFEKDETKKKSLFPGYLHLPSAHPGCSSLPFVHNT